MKNIIFAMCLFFGINLYCFAENTTDVYLLAQAGKANELQKVENIDVSDSDGDTALCSAIKHDDVNTYNILKNAGANTEHKCVKKIPSEHYEHFMTKVATTSKTWSFLGLGKWAWTAIGAGVVGGVAAAGMGGGGGSGGSSGTSDNTQNNNTNNNNNNNNILNCGSNAHQEETQCVCNTGYQNWTTNNGCVLDGENYIEQNGQAYSKLNCVNGTQNANTCSCFGGWTGDLCDTPATCDGYVSSCSTGYNITSTCQSGDNTLVQCTFDSEHYIEQNGQVYLKLYCSVGTQIGDACVNDSEIIIDNVESTSTAGVYGMYGEYNGNIANAESGIINIKNTYKSYGMEVSGSNATALNNGKIYIDNTDLSYSVNSDAYGINVGGGASAINADTGEIKITNGGANMHYAVGMYAYDATLTNDGIISITDTGGTFIGGMGIYSYANSNEITAVNNGTIILKDILGSSSQSTGIAGYDYNFRDLYITNNGTITIENSANNSTGIAGSNTIITNNGAITIKNGNHTATGISAVDSIVTNNGDIIIDNVQSSFVHGIYASNSIVNNTGTITITNTYNFNTYGIYAAGSSTVVRNTGTISVNGSSCTGNACSNNDRYIRLTDGATFVNSGVMSAPKMNLNSMGGKVIASAGSSFVVDNDISGDLHIDSDIVTSGNQTTYIAENMIDAGDTSGLNLISDSAMFDASLSGKDVVMQMKDFDTLTDNKSLAAFLKNNYDKGNGSELFSALKSMDNMSAFNGALSGFTGLNTFTQFAHEDLSAIREISFSMNNKLFENSNRDSFDISDSMGYFSFSDSHNGGSGRYGISNDKITDKLKLGYGMAMANINTNDGHGMNRQNKMWLFYMPLTYTDEGYELVIAPKAGFANSEYNRRGYNNMNYEGVIEKRIFGLMNDLRYPLTFGNWTFAPDLAFNTIVYEQSGHEEAKEFALIIPDDRTVSVETGLGLYTKYEKTLQDGSRFKLNSGLMVYREFGDTYDIKLGIRGMDGTFSLYNNNYEYRGAASFGFDYIAGRLHMYGNAQYFMDNANYMNFKGGVSYRF